VKQLDQSEILNGDKIEDRLKLKKFRWMPNPFLANGDLRQGGPLYYAKYFQDRKRALDEKSVREELAKSSESVESEKPKRTGRRSKAVWKNYRQLSPGEIEKISSLDKFSKILANEVHVALKNDTLDISNRQVYDNKFRELLLEIKDVVKEDLIALVKCMHFFGVVSGTKLSDSVMNDMIEKISSPSSRNILKPVNYIYSIQAMSRMNHRDHRLIKILDNLALCWGSVGLKNPLMLIRGANAISKLDLVSSTPFTAGLKEAISESLPRLTKSQLEKIKAITIVEIFDQLMILDYFVVCFDKKISYTRNLILAYLKYRNDTSVMGKVPPYVKEWIEGIVKQDTQLSQAAAVSYSSKLHEDVFRIMQTMGSHSTIFTSQRCGPFVFDIFLPDSNTVIEACSDFQFYNRTSKLTAEAKLRHELIRSLGFKLVPVFHSNWATLSTDTAKARWLASNL
jgi:hypothetical protein